MDIDYQTAGIGAAVGLAIGLAISASQGPEMSEIEGMIAEAVESAGEETSAALGSGMEDLRGRIDDLGSALDESQAAAGEGLAGVRAEIAALAENAGGNGDALAEARAALSEQIGALDAQMAALSERLGEIEARVAAAATGGEAAEAPEEAAAPAEPEISGATPGMTEQLADGALRVFVSGISGDGQVARLAINGLETTELRLGRSATVEVEGRPCNVTLDGIDRGHVQLSGDCAE